MDDREDENDVEKFAEPGPRLYRNRGHIRRCHSRWIKQMNRPSGNDDPDEWYSQQCGGCRFFITITGGFRSDWGVCTNALSVRDGRATFEHDGCDQFVADENGW
jgi:hypothetical protein